MFSTVVRYNRGPVEFAVSAAFERQFRLFGVVRRGLTFDTRFAPAAIKSSSAKIVYLLLEGTIRWTDGRQRTGPSLFVMRETDFEGTGGTRTQNFRAWGEPFCCVDLRIDPKHCPVDGDAEPLGEVDRLVTAGRDYLHASHGAKGQTVIADLAAAYVKKLHEHGVVRTDLATTITRDEGVRGMIWEALRPIIDGFGGLQQDELIHATGWSARRLQRLLTAMAVDSGTAWMGSWREIAYRYRVRVAVLLLSNPSLSVGDVASAVGYRSVEALAHALDASGLPPATELRKALDEPGA